MTLDELREVVVSQEEWANRVGKNVPPQDGEMVKTIWYMGNEKLYYALEKVGMLDRHAIATQTVYKAEMQKSRKMYNGNEELAREDNEYLLHAETSEEEATLPVEVPDTRTDAEKSWDNLLSLANE